MDKLCLIFPGQGSQSDSMLEKVKYTENYGKYYPYICDLLGFDVEYEMQNKQSPVLRIHDNKVSSLLTVFVSYLCLKEFEKKFKLEPDYLAGYSIGQLMALTSANSFDVKDLFSLVAARADLMDYCFNNITGKMVSVIGVKKEDILNILKILENSHGENVYISNFNAPNLLTIAGVADIVNSAVRLIRDLNPIKIIDLPLSGAWHCPLLNPAKQPLIEYLKKIPINRPAIPTLNNVSGSFFGANDNIPEQLGLHLVSPVNWEASIQKIIDNNCFRFVEIGHGNMLCKFGKFINRAASYETFDGINLCAV